MNIKNLVALIATALYAGGIAAAVANPPGAGLQQIKAEQILKQAQLQAVNLGSSAASADQRRLQPNQHYAGGVNQQHQRGLNKLKFIAEPERTGEDVYIVRLRDLPVATYDGRVKGFAPTSRAIMRAELKASALKSNQSRVTPNDLRSIEQKRVNGYANYLRGKQEAAVQAVHDMGIRQMPRLQFTKALNGFTMKLSQAQAKKLSELPHVAQVQRSDLLQLQTDRGPEFIGADKVWQGNTSTGLAQKGEGIVMGILDTGINSDHPSFADIGADGYDHTNPRGAGNYLGDCASGAVACNDKLIGVYHWPQITDSYAGAAPATGEDYQGHGSHTASTAAGNVVRDVPYVGFSLGDGDGIATGFSFDQVSGVAPHANIISYQVCFLDGCPSETMLAAVEQAIADDVDVINFSIGGSEQFPWDDAMALAFLSAREAGISVAASAGNSGPAFYTLGHSAPWYAVVAATTTDRTIKITSNSIEALGGATTPPSFYIDASNPEWDDVAGFSASSVAGSLVNAADFGDELCLSPFAESTFTSDQIVICKRGENARVQKAFNVLAGGAGGFVLYNAEWTPEAVDSDSQLFDDTFPLPGIHIANWKGIELLTWLQDGGSDHSVTLTGGSIERVLDPTTGDRLAEFSSRGPSSTYTGSLAPHISAPGVDIFAAWADEHPLHPGSAQSADWSAISGTSMASPHVAGAMALVRQAHPDWSAAEVQSALLMTAAQTVQEVVNEWTPAKPAHTHRAGSGRVDVVAAINAGLVMDETAANFEFANPHNGGDVKQLNLPQLVNNFCRDTCSWMRTVTATRDGEWTVSAGDWTYDRWNTGEGETPMNGARMDAFPANFSLKAGESQTIVFRADLTDTQFRYDSIHYVEQIEQLELWSKVIFTPSDASIPTAHWPVSINFDRAGLPAMVNAKVHRDEGSYQVQNLPLPAMANPVYRGFGAVKASVEEVTLPQDIDHMPVWFNGDWSSGNTQVSFVEVPQNTARLVVETLARTSDLPFHEWYGELDGWLAMQIGIDSNGNGEADIEDEVLCSSTTGIELNYCSITQPEAGRYWVLLNNYRVNAPDYEEVEGLIDTYRVATAVVPATSTNFVASGPTSTDGSPVNVDLNWSLDDMQAGDVAYAGFDIGNSAAPGSVGFVPVKLTRGVDDVSMSASQTRAQVGNVVDVSVHVLENTSGSDRAIDLSTVLPAGLTLVPGSVKVNNPQQKANLVVDGNSIRIAGVQQNSEDWNRDYLITTSETDAQCRTPDYGQNSSGGLVGLYQNYGFVPDFGGTAADWLNPEFAIPLSNYWGDDENFNLFNNGEFVSYPNLVVSPQGYATLAQYWDPTQHMLHTEFPYYSNPYAPFMGVLWKGEIDPASFGWDVNVYALGTPLDNSNPWEPATISGMTFGHASNPEGGVDDIIVEWVNARTQHLAVSWFGAELLAEAADRYTFNLILSKGYRYGEGEYEIRMAYGKLDFADQAGSGSVGIHGNYGPLDIFGYPWGQETGLSFGHNDLDSKLKQDLVVCYDYVGPESTQFELSFKVRVAETAAGQDQRVQFISQVDGMGERMVEAIIELPSNLRLATIADQSMMENGVLAGIAVMYQDSDATPNTITVSGDHVTASVDGNLAGASITLTPSANWHGSTQVTVTVADNQNPSDKVSTQFLLAVASDGIELGCTDSTATNFDELANSDDGSCSYPAASEPQKKKKKKGLFGGSLSFTAFALLFAFGLRRRFQLASKAH